MKKLIEMVGKQGGYSEIDIFNSMEKINRCIEKLVEAECQLDVEQIILASIVYSLSLKKQMTYGSILNFIQEETI